MTVTEEKMTSSPLLEEYLSAKAAGIKFAGPPAAELTIKTYRQQLRRLERYVNKPLHEMTTEDAEFAIEESIRQDLSASYRNLMLTAGRGFFDWAIRNKKALVTSVNPFTGIRASERSSQDKHPKSITDAQFKSIIRKIEQIDADNVANALASGRTIRNVPWVNDEARLPRKVLPVKLLYYGGLRINEAASLKIDNVLKDGIVVDGKGAKQRFVPMPDHIIKELEDYIQNHSDDDTYVFTPMRTSRYEEGTPLRPVRIHSVFREATKALKMPEWVTPHSLRHTYAKRVLDRTGRIDLVQDLLGHANSETTRIYARNDRDDIRRIASDLWA